MKRAPFTVCAALALAMLSRDAFAWEKEHHLGLGGGLAILKVDDKSTHSVGPIVTLHYAYQITDAFRFMSEYSSAIVAKEEAPGPDVPHTRPTGVNTLGAGVGYVIDVTRKWAPYGGVMATGSALTGGTLDKPVIPLGIQLAVGFEYMVTPHFGLGIAVRQHFLLTEMKQYPSYYSAFLRAEFVWGK